MTEEKRILLKNVGRIRPDSIDDYLAAGGYEGLKKAIGMEPADVVAGIDASGLRGRGGAGFPTGFKMKSVLETETDRQKYVVCNADEGEPGTFKDRVLMENDPHLLLEGVLIAARAVGAGHAYIYIRGEYGLSIEILEKAIEDAYKKGFAGKNILGSPISIDVELRKGAGSYLCGEELTLLESLEGKRGYPRIKPPFPAQVGFEESPTLVNNVETLSNLPGIILNGAEWFRSMGTEDTPGTKIFTVSGDVENPGWFEVEAGTTLRSIIYDLAGGVSGGRRLKTVLVGGAAGTFVDESVLDLPASFNALKENGAVLGSGAVMVMAEGRSLVGMTDSILGFFKHESCGKCVPCRVGTTQLIEMIGEAGDEGTNGELLNRMVAEAEYMAATSLCPLGQSPILPLGSLKKFFAKSF